ncbi:phytoene desaturase family protein [Streptomyces halobius]|uniref:NAD(P)/FAD-dependent oxidoreductase n=1 Tax=Streptomyces halobius TaxID=2879846 RepID=A0ABY4M2U7_9ACTN|nr:NAD(P)/FAD-dependent oxidoreductase [Streptomyces halobius]UQA92040.1 NAD(P)/FAD-dependent oxidoreductase [Streptomyces halobius]
MEPSETRSGPDTHRFDAIVVGSGVGGMVSAAYLAAAGKRTLVLESYDVIGGCTHVFRRAGKWEFDVGVHYLGDCGPDGQIPTILRGVGLDKKVEFLPLDSSGFDTIVFPDLTLKIPVGWDNYVRNLCAAFPAEQRQIRKVVGILRRIGGSIDHSSTPASLRGYAMFAQRAGLAARWAMLPLTLLLNAYRLSPRLKAAMAVQYGTYASPPHRTPVAVHAFMLQNFLSSGAWFPQGGGQVLSARLGEVVVAHGGQIRTRCPVKRILVEDKTVTGVELENGTRFTAPIVVSNADIKKTYLDLVGSRHLRRSTVRRVERFRMSQSFFNCYLGVDIDLSERIPNTNFYSVPTSEDVTSLFKDLAENRGGYTLDERIEQARKRLPAYISVTTIKDPDNPTAAPAGSSVLEVMTLVPDEPQAWGLGGWPEVGDDSYRADVDYLRIKEAFTEIMIQRVSEVIPGIEDHILWREAATPVTQHRYTRSSAGTPYGLEMSITQFGPFRPGVRTEINGLYLCGASTAWGPAVEGAMLSGLHAAGAALNRDLGAEIHAGTVLGNGHPHHDPHNWDPLAAAKKLATRTPRTPPTTIGVGRQRR